jgi:deoxycytidylate deaminase
VYCEQSARESRLIGDYKSDAKYAGADPDEVRKYLARDEKDVSKKHGQQVRDAFFHADYFLDNTKSTKEGLRLVADLERFCNLLVGKKLVRPTPTETGMFAAQSAALRSSCLSRQVGAALQNPYGRVISTGANEVPRAKGGVYAEEDEPDGRCFAWHWEKDGEKFRGCHNTRLKNKLRKDISAWLGKTLAGTLAELAHPKPKEGEGFDTALPARQTAEANIRGFFNSFPDIFSDMPGVKDLIEYSRSVHAEMNAILNAALQGLSPRDCVLFTTTFPCHNCARHLVAAGIAKVYYIEPFVKSLAAELHSDAIATDLDEKNKRKMLIVPFTGVGPRMYEEYFAKRTHLKDDGSGEYKEPDGESQSLAVRLRELADVEKAAAELISD